ncbi:MAG: hypothetical protein KQH63_06930 [Desulfobulbaceae bacterium]|nr:hypothetical protein [Desulfobulbaceae bacterium]
MLRYAGIFAVLLFLVSGCSLAPKPAGYLATSQKKLQAVHHWNVLAEDVAAQIKKKFKKISKEEGASTATFYVQDSKATPFDEGFRELLISNMVNDGLPLVREKTADSLTVDVEVILIHHKANRHKSKSVTPIGEVLRQTISVVRDVVTLGALTNEAIPHSEVIVTFYIVDNNKYMVRNTDIYYINDVDFSHYRKSDSLKKMKVVGK